MRAGLGGLVKRWIAVQTGLQYPISLAYVRVITVNGHTTCFIFVKYYERLLLEGLIFHVLEIYPTANMPQTPFRVFLRGVCYKTKHHHPTTPQEPNLQNNQLLRAFS